MILSPAPKAVVFTWIDNEESHPLLKRISLYAWPNMEDMYARHTAEIAHALKGNEIGSMIPVLLNRGLIPYPFLNEQGRVAPAHLVYDPQDDNDPNHGQLLYGFARSLNEKISVAPRPDEMFSHLPLTFLPEGLSKAEGELNWQGCSLGFTNHVALYDGQDYTVDIHPAFVPH